MTSFTADPATITDGDTFTLSWAAPCGFVSLAQKGKGPFQTLLPSTGSYVLRPGLDGYPTATGKTVYEARNADTATPREATVTMAAKPSTPTPAAPTISVSGPDTCYPYPSCGAVITASGSHYDSLSWSGCCSGNRTTATCDFADLTAHTCTVTAMGPGGSATAAKTVTGINTAPTVTGANPAATSCNTNVTFWFTVTDEEARVYQCTSPSVVNNPPCTLNGMNCPSPSNPSMVEVSINTGTIPAGGFCYVGLQVSDRFGAVSNKRTSSVYVNPCP